MTEPIRTAFLYAGKNDIAVNNAKQTATVLQTIMAEKGYTVSLFTGIRLSNSLNENFHTAEDAINRVCPNADLLLTVGCCQFSPYDILPDVLYGASDELYDSMTKIVKGHTTLPQLTENTRGRTAFRKTHTLTDNTALPVMTLPLTRGCVCRKGDTLIATLPEETAPAIDILTSMFPLITSHIIKYTGKHPDEFFADVKNQLCMNFR